MLHLCWHTLSWVGPMLAYVGVRWSHVALCYPYVEPSWKVCKAFVGGMLAILGLCWRYVTQFVLTSSATTFFDFSFPPSEPAKHKPSPCLAGARLSGVSLINPGAGHGPVSLPEAFGGNRRLYTLAAPAADPFVGPRVYPRPKRVDRFLCNFYVLVQDVRKRFKNIVFYSVSWPSASTTGRPWCRLCVPRGKA